MDSRFKWIFSLLALVGFDQLSKWIALHFFNSAVVYNPGSAFSLPIPQYFSIGLSVIFVVASIFMIWKKSLRHGEVFIWILIGAGALGNLVDRLRLGKVIDFIDLRFWPVFNFADIYLSCAAVIIIYFAFRARK